MLFRFVNGNSNVSVGGNGNVTVSVAGVSNVAVFDPTGVTVTGIISATGNISGNYILGNGAFLTGLPVQYGNTDVANYLPTYTGNLVSLGGPVTTTSDVTGANILTGGEVSAVGNITGNYFIGNGSQLTGVAAASVNADALVGNTLSSNVLYSSLTQLGVLTDLSVAGNTVSGNFVTGGLISATGSITSAANLVGNNVSATTIVSAPSLTGSIVSVTANITGGNVLTDRSEEHTSELQSH